MATHILHTNIDKFGRIVLPKKMRDQLGLRSGSQVQVEEEEDKIILRAIRKEPEVVKQKRGWPVISVGHPVTQEMVNDVIRKTRQKT